jgi:hypothetical protein
MGRCKDIMWKKSSLRRIGTETLRGWTERRKSKDEKGKKCF